MRQCAFASRGDPLTINSVPSIAEPSSHILRDEQGVAWVDNTNVKVVELVLDHLAYGWGAEAIHEQFPHLRLAQIHAALAFFYDHEAEFEQEILRLEREVAAWKSELGVATPAAAVEIAGVSLGLYMDVHAPAGITRALRRRGVNVLTAQEDGAERLLDPDLLDRATACGRVVFTRDSDFLAEGVRRQRAGLPFVTIVYAHQQHVSIGRCVDDLAVVALDDANGQIVYLPL